MKTVVKTANELAAWLGDAKKGDVCVYAADAKKLYGASEECDRLARNAWRYSESGLVNLVQRRASPSTEKGGGSFDYIAQRTGLVV